MGVPWGELERATGGQGRFMRAAAAVACFHENPTRTCVWRAIKAQRARQRKGEPLAQLKRPQVRVHVEVEVHVVAFLGQAALQACNCAEGSTW